MNLLSCLSKEFGDADDADADIGPIVDMIMESYNTCQQNDITCLVCGSICVSTLRYIKQA